LPELLDHCADETRRYRNGQATENQYSLELFQRALRHSAPRGTEQRSPHYSDEAARTALVEIYNGFVRARLCRAPLDPLPLDDMQQQVWLRFWQAANSGLAFDSLEAALGYLNCAVSSTIHETRRIQQRQREQSLQRLLNDDDTFTMAAANDPGERMFDEWLLNQCCARLSGSIEPQIFRLRYGSGLPPRAIALVLRKQGTLLRERDADADTVSAVLDNCRRRLRADATLSALLRGE
jgi:hypothetical protein